MDGTVSGSDLPEGPPALSQVMSAQIAQPAPQLNGTTEPRGSGSDGGYGATGDVAPRAVGNMAEQEAPVLETSRLLDAPASSTFRPPVLLEATASRSQVEAPMPSTISDLGGRPGMGIEAEGQSATATNEFFTPRSRGSGIASQNTWMGMMDGIPRWMNRLSSYLAMGHDQLAPSPLLGETPPGGRAFVLRSPQRTRPLPLPRPSTPPSSSVPAEAIQQEVQRQLSGIRLLLEDSENRNQQLQRELEELRRSRDPATMMQTLPPEGGPGGQVGHNSLLGDLATAPSGLGGQCGRNSLLGDLATAPSGPGGQCGRNSLLGDLATAPSGPGGQCGRNSLLGDLATAPSGPGGQCGRNSLLGDLATAPSGPGGQCGHSSLLGDLATAPSGPGGQLGHSSLLGDLATAPSGPGGQLGHSSPLGDLATAPSGPGGQQSYGGAPGEHLTTLRGLRGYPGQDVTLRESFSGGATGDQRPTTSVYEHPEQPPEPRGLLRSLLGGTRQRTPSPTPQSPPPQPESPMIEAIARGMQQLQQLQAQALTKGSTSTQSESLKAGTTSLTQLPDHKRGAEASLRFHDWLEITTTAMTDVSERSGQWWGAVLLVVRAAYTRWLSASHLERLTIHPEGMDELCGDPWSRMNARACTMLLGAMPQELKGDMVAQQLTQRAPAMLFRLFVWFQPGGSAERQEVLKRLQSPQDYLKADSVEAVLAEVRSWPRWLSRCRAMGMSPPDPLVMSRGLQALTAKPINASTDASFRTSMLRSTCRLDGQPTLEQVQGYQKHLQAELEGIVGAQRAAASATPTVATAAIRSVEGATPTASPKGTKTKEKSQELCRYFAKASGCKRGDKCTYNHSMSGMDKEVRSKKCLRCGSESHRAKECPVGKGSQKPLGQGERSTSITSPAPPSLATMSTAPSLSSGSQSTVQGTPWTLETLIHAAQQVIQTQAPVDGESSPEKTKAELKVLNLRDVRVSAMDRSTTALLDSGATHCLRNAHDREEWLQSEEVLVQLAGDNALTMRLSSGGSLLMPPRSHATSTSTRTTRGQTIVPLGELVKTLGYSLDWSQRGCFLVDPNGFSRSLGVSGGCPLMQEAEALALISRLEDRKREMLENATVTTQDTVEASEMMMEKSWRTYLEKYVATGGMEAALRAIRDSPMLSQLPGDCVSGLAQANVFKDGWKIFKDIEYLSRPQRRRLWTAKRWVIHLYAGCPGHFQIYQLDEGDTVVVELDVQRNRSHDVTRSSTWRLLMWAAMQGRIEAIIGGPPGRTNLGCLKKGNEEWDNKSLKAVARMVWLYAVADEGRTLNAKGGDRGRPVAFMMEHPPRETEVLGQGGRRRSVWETSMWHAFQEEYGMTEVTFDQRAMGAKGSLPTTLGTNVYYLQGLQGVGQDEVASEDVKDHTGTWSSGLTKAVVMALSFWKRTPATIPCLCPMTPAQWKRHVDSNHLDYNRECLTCVLARGTGRRHARVHHPEMFSLTVDIAGPVKPGLDSTSKGAQGKGLRYLLVGKYTLPKEFVKSYSGRKPPEDDGLQDPLDVEDTRADERNQSKGLGTPLLPACEEGDQEQQLAEEQNQSKELGTPSLLPACEEGDQGLQLADEQNQSKELGTPSLLPACEEGDQGLQLADEQNQSKELGTPSLLPACEVGDPFFE